jgi:hypothetical protein
MMEKTAPGSTPHPCRQTICASDRLRWIADFLELAGKAISVVACARGIDYSPDLHRDAQRDLRVLAELLLEHPQLASVFEATIDVPLRQGQE